MAGKAGRSGGHNKKSLAELQLSGTVRAARHLVMPAAKADPIELQRRWKAFLRRLETAKAKPGWNPVDDYAHAVVSGAVGGGKYHRLACERHQRDRGRTAKVFPYRLNLDKVARFLAFVRELRHYKGQWAGQTIVLTPYQVFRLGSMVGWVHRTTGLRRFRRAYHEIPRKNGKSLEAAIVALYITFFDGEGGADGYCAATKKDQAKIVWGDAAQLVKSSILKVGIESFARNLNDPTTMSKLEPLGSDSDSTDGLNPHLIIQDEFHAYKDRKMIDVLETATGARRQPVDMRITTAGDDPVSPGGDEHAYACQVLDEVLEDEGYFAFIAHADAAHTRISKFPESVRQLVLLCSCTVREKVAAPRPGHLHAIRTRDTAAEVSARAATTGGLKRIAPAMRSGSEKASADGPSEMPAESKSISGDGLKRTGTESTHRGGRAISVESTEFLPPSTSGSIGRRTDAAEFVVRPRSIWESTTATIQKKFAAYSASPVIPASVTSEILRTAYEEHSPTCSVRQHKVSGSDLLVTVPEDDWQDEATWRKANPNYGVSVKPDDLKALAAKAKNMPNAAAAFKQKRLNLWVNTSAPWLSLEGWRKGQTSWTIQSMYEQECWAGVDLSSKIDLTAVVLVFPPTPTRKTWRLIPWCLTPDETLEERAHRDRAPYLLWKSIEILHTNPGNRIDQDAVREYLVAAAKVFDIQQVGIDPWNAGNLVNDLHEDGFQVVEIPQTLQQMSAPAKDFEADVLDGLVDAGGNPLMAWCVSNVVVQRDGKDNIYPVKKKSRGRIDPVIAALMGRKLAALDAKIQPPSYSMLVLGGGK